jgi:DNA-binding transcriptional regulator of glucitol operon
MWHLLTIGAMVTCALLAAWQWRRAGSAMGSALNVGYGLQWPVFAVFFGVMWWRMLSMELRRIRDDGVDAPGDDSGAEAQAAEQASAVEVPQAAPAAGPSPFGPRPRSAVPPVSDEDDPELAAYNRMLAQLAARDSDD